MAYSEERGRFLVIGAGYAGLTAAIELRRKGFSVEVIEATSKLATQGDILQIGSSATRIISEWGDTFKSLRACSASPKVMSIIKSTGELLYDSPIATGFDGFPIIFAHRGILQKHFYEYALSIGVKFRFNSRVTAHFEEDDHAGVIIEGEKLQADGVIATDGIHSYGRRYVTGIDQIARTSGYAIYRSWFDLDRLAQNPLTRHFVEAQEDRLLMWVGKDTHANLAVLNEAKGAVVYVTHKDEDGGAAESWSNPGSLKDMLQNVEGWDPVCRATVSCVPEETLIDWKLLWRDPLRKWVSDKGRVVIAGDAAHPHLPTSGTGGTQAIESGAALAASVDAIGKERVPLAFKVFELLRYERTSLTQRMGWESRHRWHKTDFEAARKNPEFLKMPQPVWLYGHDAVKYTYDRYLEAIESIEKGTPFVSTNTPEGHVYEEWTIETMMALEDTKAANDLYRVANL